MNALIVVDPQNEFSPGGLRAVPGHARTMEQILAHVKQAREAGRPIAWVRHYNRPNESKAFVPGSWGAELSAGCGPKEGFGAERLFEKDVFGAFSGTGLEDWLRAAGVDRVLIAGFYTHMCLSTSVREALVRGFEVEVDAQATAACDLASERLGSLSADEVLRTALLQLESMGARIF
jgi:nicotinamidase-related amidase